MGSKTEETGKIVKASGPMSIKDGQNDQIKELNVTGRYSSAYSTTWNTPFWL